MPQILAYIGAAITSAGLTAAGAAATVPVIGGALVGAITVGTTLAAGLVGYGAATGVLSLGAAVSSWSTVALLASTALRPPSVGRGKAGSQVDFQADTNAGIPLILGRSGTAGKVVHANTSGAANKNIALFYLLALTAGPVQAVESLTANEFPVVLNGELVTGPPQFANSMALRVTPGLKPDPQAYYPPAVDAAWIPEWTAAHKVSGVACAWWTLIYDPKSYATGLPKPLFVVRGPPVYDPRHDSTFPGGSGPQRWNDETTWSFTGNENPFLQGLAWCIGRRDNGILTFGVGAPIEAIDVAAYVEGANVCDANAWKVGGEVLSTDRKWDVLRTILQAGGGEPLKLGGRLSAYVRTPRVVIAQLTGKDAIGEVSITGMKRRRDRINQIIPNYRSEEHGWEMVPAGAVTVATYVTADGAVRSREGAYTLVQQPKQAAELAAYDLVDAREFEPVVLPLGPKFAAFRPGDCIGMTEPEFGMSSQQLIIQTRETDPTTGRLTFTCRSESPGKHEYALGRTPNPPPISTLLPTDPTVIARPDAGSWQAVGGVLAGADGTTVPAIIVTGQITDANVGEVIVEWRVNFGNGSFGEWASSHHPHTVRRVEIRALLAKQSYNVRVRYKSVRGVESDLSLDLGLVTTGGLVSGGVTHIGGMTPDDLIDEINKIPNLENQWVIAVGSGGGVDGSGPYQHIAGIKLAAGTDVSAMAFIAEEIGFTNGINNVYPLTVIGNKVIATSFQADDIAAHTITADMIIGGEVTKTLVTPGGSKVNFVGGETEDLRFTYTSIGGDIVLDCYGELGTTTTVAAGTTFILKCDGAEVGRGNLFCPGSWGGNGLSFPVSHRPAAGPHTWALSHIGTAGSGASNINRTLVVMTELKR